MYRKIKAYVEKYHMLTAGDRVIAGVSGGADSVCLLFLLLRLKEEYGFGLSAVHVNHGLRGAEADADEAYVREVCAREGVPLTVVRRDVRAEARARALTEEEAGREVRREAFLAALKEQSATKIALAHHMDDNAETLLWNLCRGTGLKGLGGIAPVSGVWIRPLLCVKRREIVSYLKKWEISYCTDRTNEEDTYTRNRIRGEVMPVLAARVNERSAEHMAETAEQMRLLSAYVSGEASRLADACTKTGEGGKLLLSGAGYGAVPEALKGYVLHEILCRAAGRSRDIEAVHIRLLGGLFGKQTGRRLDLPYGLRAVRVYEGVEIGKSGEAAGRGAASAGAAGDAAGEAVVEAAAGGVAGESAVEAAGFRMRVADRGEEAELFEENPYTKRFDYDIIKNTVKIRHREPGDYITISRAGGTQKLKRYFINEKIPQSLRDKIWLVADGSHILWVVGYRYNEAYRVTDETRRILEISFYGGESDGRDSKSDV